MVFVPVAWALDLAVAAALAALAASLAVLALRAKDRRLVLELLALARAQRERDTPRLGLSVEPRPGDLAFRFALWNEGLRDTAVRACWVDVEAPGKPAERCELTLFEPEMTAGAAEALEHPPLFDLGLKAGERRAFLALALDRKGRKALGPEATFRLHVAPVAGAEVMADVPALPTPLQTFLARP